MNLQKTFRVRIALSRWIALLAILMLLQLETSYAADGFKFKSTPGSWIGQGGSFTFTVPSRFVTTPNHGYPTAVFLSAFGYELAIEGPFNTQPTVGMYSDAVRWSSLLDEHPGMSFTAPGRGDNTLSGFFNVLQADYNPDGSIKSFAVDFLQYDEQSTENWTLGGFRLNSSIPIPEPSTLILGLLGFAIVGLAARRRR